MELLKTALDQYKEIYNFSEEYTEVQENIVPDINPDILEITHVNAYLISAEKSVSGETVSVSGMIETEIFYRSDIDEKPYSMKGQLACKYSYSAPGCSENDEIFADIKVMSAGAALVNSRKVALKVLTSASVKLYQRQKTELINGVRDAEDGIQTLVRPERYTYINALAQKRLVLSEDIRASKGEISADDSIVNAEISWHTEDVKALANKIMLRGAAELKLMLMSAVGSAVKTASYMLPFSQIIECDGVMTEDEIRVEYSVSKLLCRLGAKAENELFISCDMSADTKIVAERSADIDIMRDIYSTIYEMEISERETGMSAAKLSVREVPVQIKCDPEYPALKICGWRYACQGKPVKNTLYGRFYFTVFYESTAGRIYSVCVKGEAETPGDKNRRGGFGLSAEDIRVEVTDSGEIEVRFQAVFRQNICVKGNDSQICGYTVCTDRKRKKAKRGTLILRSMDEDTDIWEIAKQYGTTSASIESANKLINAADSGSRGKLIMIPISQ
ncbi:MAG: DUF3794 domain-containing protein [Clostridia bacterium]|nr:DUF3794 domain-containing protein [Clostridia bacterium]